MLLTPPRDSKKHNLTSILKNRYALNELIIPASKAGNVKTKNKVTSLAGLVTLKIEDGNVKAVLRLLSSENKPAMKDEATTNALRAEHSITAIIRKQAAAHQGHTALKFAQVDIIAVIKAFSAGSSGGPDGVRPQYIMDMMNNKENGHALIASITSCVNMLLKDSCHPTVILTFFDGRQIALEKKSGQWLVATHFVALLLNVLTTLRSLFWKTNFSSSS